MKFGASAMVRTQSGGSILISETTITDNAERGPVESQGFHLLVMSLEVFWSQPLPASGIVTVGRSSASTVRIEDGMASRDHARIHVGSDSGVPVLTIEDVGSANGTRVRDTIIKPGDPAPILPGDAILIGSTVLMVIQDRPVVGHRRVWSHAYFESRVEEECARAARSRAKFALARVRFARSAPWTRVTPVLARDLIPQHVFASYGPKDYEILFVDSPEGEPEAALARFVDALRAVGLDARSALAWYPKDGRTGEALLGSANAALRAEGRRASGEPPVADMTGMRRVRALAARAAPSNINVLILGEMGVGKDVLARLIHQLSPRAAKPFVALNCASLTESLMESELFGHEKSSFTGAVASKVGLFESANGGTVFLDEIGEMPPSMQAKLLQAIELREVRPVGAVRARPIDVRFLSATNVDIEGAVAKGAFRGDLMYRLNTLTLAIPPLRDRKDEIPSLAEAFVAHAWRDPGREEPLGIRPEAMDCLPGYHWPGNIRELKNVIERAVVLCDGAEILPEHLPPEKMRHPERKNLTVDPPELRRTPPAGSRPAHTLPILDDPRDGAERQRILDALEACAWSQTRAADLLGMSRRTFVTKLDRYGIPRPQKRKLLGDEELERTNLGQRIAPEPDPPPDC